MQYSDKGQHVMQLTLFPDLSLRVITLVAIGEPGCKYTAAEVAESLSASRAYISKVVSRLAKLDFLDVVKGCSGGIYLRDSATDKSVDKLLRTLEDNEVVGCVGTDCPLLSTCLLCDKLATVQEAFFAALDPVLIANLIPAKPVGGTGGDTPERGSVPEGSTFSVRLVQVQS